MVLRGGRLRQNMSSKKLDYHFPNTGGGIHPMYKGFQQWSFMEFKPLRQGKCS